MSGLGNMATDGEGTRVLGSQVREDKRQLTVLIWSEEHAAWWRANHMGYTTSIAEAGRYPVDEAEEIVRQANFGTVFHEVAIAIPANLDALIRQAKH